MDSRPYVLIVDDEPAAARLVARTLGAEGFNTSTVNDGQAAIDRTWEINPDVLLVDVGMPTMSGLDVLRELRPRHQVPVILMSDTVLAVRSESIPRPNLDEVKIVERSVYRPNGRDNGIPAAEGRYLRYELTESGISAMAVPGTPGGQYVATGLEHNEAGRPRYDAVTHAEMTRKRFKKLERAALTAPPAHFCGDPSAEVGILTWGSTFGAVHEAVERLQERGIRVHGMAPRQLFPLPDLQLKPFLDSKRVVLVPEVNYTGQFADLLATRYQRDFKRVNVYGGQPFKVAEIVAAVEGVVQHV